MNKENFVGKKFERLSIISVSHIDKYTHYNVVCDCGVKKVVTGNNLKNGSTKSCGCLSRENAGNRRRTHGMSKTKYYLRYRAMLDRCYNPKNEAYKDYGGRGISVCDRWREPKFGFINYMNDIGEQPSPKHEIDRADNNGNYDPLNFRWATRIEQTNNTRRNRLFEYNGQIKSVSEWARIFNIKMPTLHARLRTLTFEQAINKTLWSHPNK